MAGGSVALPFAAVGANIIGGMISGEASYNAGQMRRKLYDYHAAVEEQNAKQALAQGTMAAAEERRQTQLVQSRAIALGAAGGQSVTDAGMVQLLTRNAGEGAYRASLALYSGEERQRQMNLEAAGLRASGEYAAYEGKMQRLAYRTRIIGDLARGASNFMGDTGGTS